MKRYVAARLANSLVLLWLVVSLTFVALHIAPGDPASTIIDPRASSAQIAKIRSHYGFDQGLLPQYKTWLGRCLRGDLGISFLYQRSTASVIRSHLAPTVLLGGAATVLAVLFGLACGILAALRRGTWADAILRIGGLALYASPSFWLGLMLLLLFGGVGLGWFPSSGMLSPLAPTDTSPWHPSQWLQLLHHLVLPAAVLATPLAVQISRLLRFGLEEQLGKEYVTASRALGFKQQRIVAMAVRACLGPVIQTLGTWMPVLVGGAVVVESVFAWPGLGSVAVAAISARDYSVVLAITMMTGAVVVFANLLADILHALIDPRVRYIVTNNLPPVPPTQTEALR